MCGGSSRRNAAISARCSRIPTTPTLRRTPRWSAFPALVQKPLARCLGRVKRRPEAELGLVTVLQPVQTAGQVGLDGDFLHVRQVGQAGQRPLVAAADQRLAPGREEEGQAVAALVLRPRDEPFQGGGVRRVFGVGLGVLGEGAVGAAVVAARQRPAIEQGQVHRSSYASIRRRIASEQSQGPRASERSIPASVNLSRPSPSSARPWGISSARWGRSSSADVTKRRR